MNFENQEPKIVDAGIESGPETDGAQEAKDEVNFAERLKFLIAKLEKGEANLEIEDWKELGIYAGILENEKLLMKIGIETEEDSKEAFTAELNGLFSELTSKDMVEIDRKKGKDVGKIFAILIQKYKKGNSNPKEKSLVEGFLKNLKIKTLGGLENLKSLLGTVELSEEIVLEAGSNEAGETDKNPEVKEHSENQE